VKRTVNEKLCRWRERLQRYQYSVRLVSGDANLLPDLMSRITKREETRDTKASCVDDVAATFTDVDISDNWKEIPFETKTSLTTVSTNALLVSSSLDEEFIFPSKEEIWKVHQTTEDKNIPEDCKKGNDGYIRHEGKVWVPEERDLKARIMVIAHCGSSGHRRLEIMKRAIEKQFWWNGMSTDIKTFYNTCIHCLIQTDGQRIPRPRGDAIHATERNEMLNLDFLQMVQEDAKNKHILVIRDNFTGYSLLFPAATPKSVDAIDGLRTWISLFGVPKVVVLDNATSFTSKAFSKFLIDMHIEKHIIVAYSHGANAVERTNRTILSIFRALI
jgi:hypothetical protein